VLPKELAVHGISIEYIGSALLVDGLRLLVCQPAALGNAEDDNAWGVIPDRAAILQRRNNGAVVVVPGISLVIAVCIADVVVVLRPVRAGLLLVLCVFGVIPAFVVDESAVHPR